MDIYFGAVAPKLSEQIKGLDPLFERDADDITRLYVRGLLSESTARKARERLIGKIRKSMAKKEKRNG